LFRERRSGAIPPSEYSLYIRDQLAPRKRPDEFAPVHAVSSRSCSLQRRRFSRGDPLLPTAPSCPEHGRFERRRDKSDGRATNWPAAAARRPRRRLLGGHGGGGQRVRRAPRPRRRWAVARRGQRKPAPAASRGAPQPSPAAASEQGSAPALTGGGQREKPAPTTGRRACRARGSSSGQQRRKASAEMVGRFGRRVSDASNRAATALPAVVLLLLRGWGRAPRGRVAAAQGMWKSCWGGREGGLRWGSPAGRRACGSGGRQMVLGKRGGEGEQVA
jgi:hypothetical protein